MRITVEVTDQTDSKKISGVDAEISKDEFKSLVAALSNLGVLAPMSAALAMNVERQGIE